jgi:metallophosphoesterase (TIGR00282 family)
MSQLLSVLFIADVVGSPGINLLDTMLPSLITKYKAEFVIVNGENAHEGKGLNEKIVSHFYELGTHVITGGNHSFDKWKIYPYMKRDKNLLRPMNYPKGAHGYGYVIYELPDFPKKIGVLNIQGRTFMQAIDDPFRTADFVIEKMKEETDIIIVDFHAEATAEKWAMGWYLDGRASLMIGTHTHVPTNDARIFPEGMGYITDAGMTGAFNSVLGMDKSTAIKRFLLSTPHRYKLANGDNRICGVYSKIDVDTGNCVHIEPVLFPKFVNNKEEE